jgi:hypothetical protein
MLQTVNLYSWQQSGAFSNAINKPLKQSEALPSAINALKWSGMCRKTNSLKSPETYTPLPSNKPKEYPQQPETKTATKHAMGEVCLLPSPSYSRGRACKAQSRHKHFMKNRFSKRVCNTVEAEGPIFPKLVRRVFLKELLSTSLVTSST